MAMDIASLETPDWCSIAGCVALDPFQTHAIARSRGPRALAHTWHLFCRARTLPPTHPEICAGPGTRGEPHHDGCAINKKMLKEASLLSRQLRSINRLDAIIVSRPVRQLGRDGSDYMLWLQLQVSVGVLDSLRAANGASCLSAQPESRPRTRAPSPQDSSSPATCTSISSAARCPPLSTMSLSPSVHPNRDDCTNYAVGELARFVMQSLPLESRLATLRHAEAVAQDERTAHLGAFLARRRRCGDGPCRIDRAQCLQPERPEQFAEVIDAVDTCMARARVRGTAERGPRAERHAAHRSS